MIGKVCINTRKSRLRRAADDNNITSPTIPSHNVYLINCFNVYNTRVVDRSID